MNEGDAKIKIERLADGSVMVTITTGVAKHEWKMTRETARWAGERLIAMTELLGEIGGAAIAVEEATR